MVAETCTFVRGCIVACVVVGHLCIDGAHVESVAISHDRVQSIIVPTTPGAIQKAFDSLPATGDVELRLAAGVHMVTSPILLHPGQKLDGSRQVKVIADDAQKSSSISGGIAIPPTSWASVPGKTNM